VTVDMLGALLDACRSHAESPALSQGSVTLTYAELDRRIRVVAASLVARRFAAGDRVLFSVRPNVDGICLALGIIAAGGTVVFADPGAGEAMFRARAALAAPKWVAAESLLYLASSGPLKKIARRRGLELPPYTTVVPDARHIFAGRWLPGVPRGSVSLKSLLAGATVLDDVAGSGESEALIIFTSGTTAAPKAVVHSRNSLGTGLAGFASHVRFAPGDRLLSDQLMIGIPALIAGAHWRLPAHGTDPGAKPEHFLEVLPGTDALFMVPAALDSLLRLLDADPSKTPALSTLLIGGAPVLRPLLERVKRRWPDVRVCAIYGMTEILPVAIADGGDKLAFGGDGDYVGTLLPTIEARIDEGELILGGPGLALGYLGQPPLVELRTGDLATIDRDRLVLSGRLKDMFIRGSTNVYPGLYEPVIAGIHGVTDVAMVGVPDDIGDDRVVLVIVPARDVPAGLSSEHPLIATVASALPGLIDAAVLPDRVLVVDEFPRAGRGRKIDRAALASQVAEFLG
jgi:acyl-CoA synthetase (AMP-forming)/AMP-acid ligase II